MSVGKREEEVRGGRERRMCVSEDRRGCPWGKREEELRGGRERNMSASEERRGYRRGKSEEDDGIDGTDRARRMSVG